MSKLTSFFKLTKQMRFSRMREKISEVHKKSGRARPLIFADMIWCGLRYRAGYMDYALFEMYRLPASKRKTILTRGIGNEYVAALNDPKYRPVFDRKELFFEAFHDCIGRRYLNLETASAEDFIAFASALPSFVAKPIDGTHGDRVEKIDLSPETDLPALRNRLLQNGQTLLEEVIAQHEALAALYAGSINTVRIVTLLRDGEAHVIAASLRLGNGGSFVDNFSSGGMVACVDRETGILTSVAADGAGKTYEIHPFSGAALPCAQIPLFPDCLALVRRAALRIPEVGYVAWDIAVTPNGPLLVEGNCFPGHVLYSLPGHSPDDIGILPALEAIIPRKALRAMKQF
ncbi:hypothetical protein LJC34_00965 [Oscillospiraceae bacterium OttesenSCG-928-G22]|nr:hypothetical protein [Oscillospiraceae bacterium OttesenSCG-928-G22]